MTPHNLYDRVAERLNEHGLPISVAAVIEVERALREERRACAYDRAGVPITRGDVIECGGCAPPVIGCGERGPQ